jgi:multidrug efflux pump subunit AcrA (membrane-fusion protein)
VQTGQRTNGEVEIQDGLKPQELVVVKGSFMLKSELLKNSIKEE